MFLRLAVALLTAFACHAELSRIETLKTEPFASEYEIVTAKAHFTLDPRLPANGSIADLALAPKNARGLVEAVADLVLIQPRDPARANGTTLFEVSNRGGFSALAMFNGAPSGRMAPGNEFLMKQGYTLAWLGWQFGLPETAKFRLQAPTAPVRSIERWYALGSTASTMPLNKPGYCASTSAKQTAQLYTRASLSAARQTVASDKWSFPDPCSIQLQGGFQANTLYELVYEAQDAPVAGIGLAAVRDFISWMKTKNALRARRAVGFGYSQSARFLRQFVYDGFNADEQGRAVFDGLMLAAGGAGRGSFNHRFAEPGIAGNSVEAFDEPVDIFPFTDDGLLERARQQRAVPRIFHIVGSTEYWARVASLVHTSGDGKRDVPLLPTSRFYYLAGTQHSGAAIPPPRAALENHVNPYSLPIVFPALLTAMQGWLVNSADPPPSRYPTIANGDLVTVDKLKPAHPIKWPTFVPPITALDFGPDFARTRVITKQPPEHGKPYTLLVPQVDGDGNEVGGLRLPHVAVPLATYTGWNRRTNSQEAFGKLAGLSGSYIPFAASTVAQRYADKAAYLQKIEAAAKILVRDRFLLPDDVAICLDRASREWDWRAAAAAQTSGN